MIAVMFFTPFLIPWIFLIGSWRMTRTRRAAFKQKIMGLCVLLSLPVGFVAVMSVVGWKYLLEPGHNPGWAVVLAPLIVGWLSCVVVWLVGLILAIFRREKSK